MPGLMQTNPVTGEVLGWQMDGQDMVPAPDRAALENGCSGALNCSTRFASRSLLGS